MKTSLLILIRAHQIPLNKQASNLQMKAFLRVLKAEIQPNDKQKKEMGKDKNKT